MAIRRCTLALLGMLGAPTAVLAAGLPTSDWQLCPAPTRPTLPNYGDDLVHVLADKAFLKKDGTSELLGHVQITRGDQTLMSEALSFDNQTQEAVSPGPLTLESPTMQIRGGSGRFNLGRRSGQVNDTRYQYYPAHAQGRAAHIARKTPSLTTLTRATYSTCPIGHQTWVLSASSVRLDQKADQGVARNVVLRFKNVPILYTPYLSFPISNKRKSGLLPPVIGESTNSGFEYRQPIYWNIAPQADATFTPQILTRRGVGLGTEFRYLSPHSYSVLEGNYLPNDRLYGNSRWLYAFHQQATPLPGLSTHINYNRVSDNAYFNDLGNSLDVSSTTELERSADATYSAANWNLTTRVQKYQILDPTLSTSNLPYERLPQITFNGWLPDNALGLQTTLNTDWTRFVRRASVTGSRLDVTPGLRLPLTGAAWFLTPALKYRYTSYHLQDQAPGTSADPTRSLPIASLDAGLYFERSAGAHTLQTLEPRLYYLYVPYRDQQGLPVFDTSLNDFGFSQLFSDNRFSGGDRVGDANQLSLALTTRFINTDTGAERFSASLGQILYFRPRKVTLPGNPVQTQHRSDYAGQLNAALADHWNATGDMTYDPYRHAVDSAYMGVQYHLDRQRLVNLGYQFRRGQVDQSDVSFIWPLNAHWQATGRWNFSVRDGRVLDAFAGLQYDSCCWAARILARRYVTSTGGKYNSGIYFELVLKGLGNLGNPIGSYLQRTIPNYAPSS